MGGMVDGTDRLGCPRLRVGQRETGLEWSVRRDVGTEAGLPSYWNVLDASSTEQICPLTGMTMEFIIRLRIFLRLNGNSINNLGVWSPCSYPSGRQSQSLVSLPGQLLGFLDPCLYQSVPDSLAPGR